MKLHFQNKKSKIDRMCGSSCKVPACQAQSPEFKLHPTKKVICRYLHITNWTYMEENDSHNHFQQWPF
jgi:hypothetical protein